MRIGGAGRKRGYVIAVVAAVVLSGGAAVAIGAIGHGESGKNPDAAGLSALSRRSSASPSPSASRTPSARPSSRPTAGKTTVRPTYVVRPVEAPSSGDAGSRDVSHTAAPRSSVRPVEGPAKTSGSLFTTGQLSCQSGAPVEGVWVQAAHGSGWASWKKLGNGSVADWWYTLPVNESYHLNVGCGGSPGSWTVSVRSSTVSGGHNSFNCYDAPGANYKTCVLR